MSSLLLRSLSSLREMTNALDLVVPVLTDRLQDSRPHVQVTVALHVEHFGEKARPAAPALVSLLGSPDPEVRRCATQTLRRIDPHALTNAPPP